MSARGRDGHAVRDGHGVRDDHGLRDDGDGAVGVAEHGMLDPAEGSIEIDGDSPSVYFQWSGGALGYVGAEPFLLDGTLQQNLEYGLDQKPSAAELWAVLEQARLAETVRALDLGSVDPGDAGIHYE